MSGRTVIPISAHPQVGKISEAEYFRLYEQSLAEPDRFWAEHGKRIDWIKPFTKVRNAAFERDVHIAWYEDGTLNASYNCIDRHLPKRARADRDPVGGRRSGRGPAGHLPRAARGGVPARECVEGAGCTQGRSGHDLSPDDPGGGSRDARLRSHRRNPFRRLRRLLTR